MTWKQIGNALGLSREQVRKIAFRAFLKIRRRDPDLSEAWLASLRIQDALAAASPAQQMIQQAPHEHGDYQRARRPW